MDRHFGFRGDRPSRLPVRSSSIEGGRTCPDDPPVKLRLATAALPLEALRSVADFSAYLAMANPPPPPKEPIGFMRRR